MNLYEKLQKEASDGNIEMFETKLESKAKGLYCNNIIILDPQKHNTTAEKACTMAEELGHHNTSSGYILDLDKIESSKQEYRARLYAYNKLIGLKGLVNAYQAKCQNIYEIAEYLNVTLEFLMEALECYKSKYGLYAEVDNFAIIFYKGNADNTDMESYGYKILEKQSF